MPCINTYSKDFFLKPFGFLLLLDFNLYFITSVNRAYHIFHRLSCLFIRPYLSVLKLIVIGYHQSKMLVRKIQVAN